MTSDDVALNAHGQPTLLLTLMAQTRIVWLALLGMLLGCLVSSRVLSAATASPLKSLVGGAATNDQSRLEVTAGASGAPIVRPVCWLLQVIRFAARSTRQHPHGY